MATATLVFLTTVLPEEGHLWEQGTGDVGWAASRQTVGWGWTASGGPGNRVLGAQGFQRLPWKPTCLSWLGPWAPGHLPREPARMLVWFLGLPSWFGVDSVALLPSKRGHSPWDSGVLTSLSSVNLIQEVWGPVSIAWHSVLFGANQNRRAGWAQKAPKPAVIPSHLPLSPASKNKRVKRLDAGPPSRQVCAGKERDCVYAFQRIFYSLGLSSLEFFFFFCKSPLQRTWIATFKIIY